MKLLLLLTFLFSCANMRTGPGIDKVQVELTEKVIEKIYTPKNIIVYNGKVKFIEFPSKLSNGSYKILCKEQDSKKPLVKSYPVTITSGVAFLFYPESYHSIAKSHQCYMSGKIVFNIKVKQFPYKEERLKVAKKKVWPSKKDRARISREWLLTHEVYKKSSKTLLIKSPFKIPLDSYVTSVYGNRRIFNEGKRSQHLGYDLRAKVGVRIPASNNGKVVFTGNLFYTGNVVIIDHGLNIFTLYAHLSKINVKTGDHISQGTVVGLAGMTGRVSGPHLHWGVKMNGNNMDGFSLVKESQSQYNNNELVN